MKDLETRYLERLSDLYPTIAAASTEIINLQAILNLPKGNRARGRELYDVLESYVRKGFFALDKRSVRTGGISCGMSGSTPDSPLFGKNKMATFERYFLAEKETHVEKKNPYYALLENEKVIDKILIEFGLDPSDAHIVNGQVADLERLLAAYRSGEIIEKV